MGLGGIAGHGLMTLAAANFAGVLRLLRGFAGSHGETATVCDESASFLADQRDILLAAVERRRRF